MHLYHLNNIAGKVTQREALTRFLDTGQNFLKSRSIPLAERFLLVQQVWVDYAEIRGPAERHGVLDETI